MQCQATKGKIDKIDVHGADDALGNLLYSGFDV